MIPVYGVIIICVRTGCGFRVVLALSLVTCVDNDWWPVGVWVITFHTWGHGIAVCGDSYCTINLWRVDVCLSWLISRDLFIYL